MKVKLIIWDLDDTLWEGTLAEEDDLLLHEFRASVIRQFNKHGIVNAICSKNEHSLAKSQLQRMNLWDEFVFPKISFSPKGQIVKQILEEMHLRPENTIFIDDNNMNLREVEHYVPGIHTLDALDGKTDTILAEILEKNKHINKSRLDEYRILEAKVAKSADFSDNNEFLASCNIRLCRVFGIHNLPHADRIEELINRTNQLNYTMNRVEPGSIGLEIADNALNESWSLFAWDDFGDYGLIGFAMIRNNELIHFLFSCRTMNMGIESHVMHMLSNKFPKIKQLVEPRTASYITMIDPDSEDGLSAIKRMSEVTKNKQTIRIMANCQGGIIGHYMASSLDTYIEQWPKITTLQKETDESNPEISEDTKFIIYGIFNDYDNRYWEFPPSDKDFQDSLSQFIKRAGKSKILFILPAEELNPACYNGEGGISINRVNSFNNIVRGYQSNEVECISLDTVISESSHEQIHDARHYPRDVWKQVGEYVGRWLPD